WQPRGRTKEAGPRSGRRADRRLRARRLVRQPARAEKCETVGVPITVIADLVVALDDSPGELRVALDPLADTEERGGGVVRFEYIEDRWGHFRVGPIVDRDSDCTARSRCG